jgi:hypothetical protein
MKHLLAVSTSDSFKPFSNDSEKSLLFEVFYRLAGDICRCASIRNQAAIQIPRQAQANIERLRTVKTILIGNK